MATDSVMLVIEKSVFLVKYKKIKSEFTSDNVLYYCNVFFLKKLVKKSSFIWLIVSVSLFKLSDFCKELMFVCLGFNYYFDEKTFIILKEIT